MLYLVIIAVLSGGSIVFDQGELVKEVPAKNKGYVRLESQSNPAHRAEIAQERFDELKKTHLLKLA